MAEQYPDHSPVRKVRPIEDFGELDVFVQVDVKPEDTLHRKVKVAKNKVLDALQNPREMCAGPTNGGCACTGRCLQSALAALRYLTERADPKTDTSRGGIWCDQLHGALYRREGEDGMVLCMTTENI